MPTYCVFSIGERRIGIAMNWVREVIEHQWVLPTRLPLTPPFVQGLFNLRGQVLPLLDLAAFVGAKDKPAALGRDDRAVVVERGRFRFATMGRRIDTVDAAPDSLQPLVHAALYPALDCEARTEYGNFHIIHMDRLEACLSQGLKTAGMAAPLPGGVAAAQTPAPGEQGVGTAAATVVAPVAASPES